LPDRHDAPRIIFTQHAEDMLIERAIDRAWVEATIAAPETVETDSKRPEVLRAFRRIPERGGRYLRVCYALAGDAIRIVTVFFDRRGKS
jgi:hypothetical protein